MSTFDAGAIKATLTLDRTRFTNQLKIAREQADRFRAKPITINVLIGRERWNEQLKRLQAEIRELNGQRPEIVVKADTKQLAAASKRVREVTKRLDGLQATIKIDARGADSTIAEMGAVRQATKAIVARDVKVNVDADTAEATGRLVAFRALIRRIIPRRIHIMLVTHTSGSERAFDGMRLLITAVIALLPALVAAAAGATAAIVAFGAAIFAILPGLAILAVGIKNAFGEMSKANGDVSKMSPPVRELHKQVGVLSKTLKSITGPVVFTLMAESLKVLNDILKALAPSFQQFGQVALSAVQSLGKWLDGPQGATMFKFFKDFGALSFGKIISILGNLTVAIIGVFEAFGPFAMDMLDGLDRLTAGWAKLGQGLGKSNGFQQFLAFVRQTGPQVLDVLGAFVDAVLNIAKAVAPFAGPVLSGLEGVFRFIAELDPSVLAPIAAGIMVIVGGIQLLTMAQAALNIVLSANPIGLIIIAIAALVVAIIALWKHNEDFRNVVLTVWAAIKTAIGATVNWITGTAVPFLVNAWNSVVGVFNTVWSVIASTMSSIAAIIAAVVANISAIWTGFWGGPFGKLIEAVWGWITTIIQLYIKLVVVVITTQMKILHAAWTAIWTAIRILVTVVWAAIKAVVIPAANFIKNQVVAAWNALKASTQSIWNAIRGVIDTQVAALKRVFSGFKNYVLDPFKNAGSWLLDAGKQIMQGLIDGITRKIGELTGLLKKVTNLIPVHKGPKEVDAKLLTPNGILIGKSLIKGLASTLPTLRGMLRNVTKGIKGEVGVKMDPPPSAPSGGSGRMDPPPAQAGASVSVVVHNYNPVAEKSSESTVASVTRLAQLGVFG